MKVFTLLLVALALVAVNAVAPDSSFLDDDNSKHESFSNKKFHKIDLDKDETVNDGKGSKYRTTTEEPDSTESPVTTTKAASTTQASPITTEGQSADKPSTSTPKIKTTTSNAPLDNHTTTERIKMTTEKSAHVLPAYQSHSLRWILGGLFFTIFVVILALYAYKFYQNRSESSYQNL